jgi:hypothetical protein
VAWPTHVHAVPIVTGRVTRAPAGPDTAIVHYPYANIEEWVARNNRYTSYERDERARRGVTFRRSRVVTGPVRGFLSHYVRGGGFRDGPQGVWIAILMAGYELLIELKRWEADVDPAVTNR